MALSRDAAGCKRVEMHFDYSDMDTVMKGYDQYSEQRTFHDPDGKIRKANTDPVVEFVYGTAKMSMEKLPNEFILFNSLCGV